MQQTRLLSARSYAGHSSDLLKMNVAARDRNRQYFASMAPSNTTGDSIAAPSNPSKFAVRSSGNLQDYLKAYWIVSFSIGSCHSAQLSEIQRHISWYGGKHRICSLDRHPHAQSLIRQIESLRSNEEELAQQELEAKKIHTRDNSTAAGPSPSSPGSDSKRRLFTRSNLSDFGSLYLSPSALPAVFVNQHYLGGLEDLQMLERQKKLKDVLQFGFEWKSNNFLAPVAGIHNDKALFKGQYVGAPVKRPVAMLPQVSTRFNVDDPYEA